MNKTKETHKKDKYQKLILGLVFDAIGMVSFSIPLIGEGVDIIWAPISALLMAKMYSGNTGKIAGLVSFLEEILPGLDMIPTFTLTWIYQYVLKGRKVTRELINSEKND